MLDSDQMLMSFFVLAGVLVLTSALCYPVCCASWSPNANELVVLVGVQMLTTLLWWPGYNANEAIVLATALMLTSHPGWLMS